jgi:SEC-C motif domain protein
MSAWPPSFTFVPKVPCPLQILRISPSPENEDSVKTPLAKMDYRTMTTLCPCHSGKEYADCCAPYHNGQQPPHALALMRSRYSAYAKGLTHYIIATTHPENPNYKKNHTEWLKELSTFCRYTEFRDLEIGEVIDGDKESFVTFTAFLDQNQVDITFTEKSRFLKEPNGQWLYRDSLYC